VGSTTVLPIANACASGNIEVVHVAEEDGQQFYAPTYENVKKGVYPLSRYLYMVTNGIPESGSLTDRFIDFVKSPEGQNWFGASRKLQIFMFQESQDSH